MAMQAEQFKQRAQQIGNFVRSNLFPMVIGGSLIALGVLMLIGSFAFSWVAADIEDLDGSASAISIWTGGNDDIQTLDLDLFVEASNPFNDDADDIGGFGDVRLLDRFLTLLPLGALALITLSAAYMFLMNNLPWLTPMRALVGMAGIACFLLLLPFIWESLSVNNWNNSDVAGSASRTQVLLLASELNSTLEQQILGFLAFLIAMTGLVLYLLSEQGVLGSPQGAMAAQPRPPQARPTPPRPGQPEPSIPSPQPPAPPSQSSEYRKSL
jgi:hypothetical protein